MPGLFVPAAGAVFSADIAVPEHAREARFYGRVLGTGEKPLWREHDLMNNRGVPIIGLGERNSDLAALPLQWMPHIQVADVGASAGRAVQLGGRELMHGRGEDGGSQWAVLLDPNGAAFGIVPVIPAEALSSGVAGETPDGAAPIGHIAWLDLTVADASSTCEFYREVVGWAVQEVEMKDEGGERYVDFNLLDGEGKPGAGVCHARGANADVPAVWMIYLPVGDLAESIARVAEEGGKIVKTAKNAQGQYVYAAIQDPVGVHLALIPG